MVRSVILMLVVAAVLVFAFVGYRNWSQSRDIMSGSVRNGPSEPGDDAAPEPPPPQRTQIQAARQSAPANEPDQPSNGTIAPPSTAEPAKAPATIPASDTIAPNPPNGLAYAGSGRFEVYRQGDLTWRVNTETGKACILFATNEQWRKPQVYRHGCGSSAVQ